MHKDFNQTKGFIALLASGLIYGSFGIWIKLLSQELTTYQQIALRNLIGFVLTIFMILLLRQKIAFNGVKKIYIFLYSFFFPIGVIFFVFAMLQTKFVTAIFAFYASSLLASTIIGSVLLKDKNTPLKYFGLILSLIGLIFLSYPFSLSHLNIGFVFGLLSGIFDSASNGFKRFLSGKIDRFVLVGLQMLGGIIVAGSLILLTNQVLLPTISFSTLLVALIFGALLVLVVFLTLVGFQNFDLNLGTMIIASELLFGPIAAMLVFKEIPTKTELIGGFIIVSSIVITNLPIINKKQSKLKSSLNLKNYYLCLKPQNPTDKKGSGINPAESPKVAPKIN